MPLKEAVEYVAAAYTFAFVLLLLYLLIMSKRLRTVQSELRSLRALAQSRISLRQTEAERRVPQAAPTDARDQDLGRPTAGSQGREHTLT